MLAQLFLCFVQVGLFSVGGGYAAIPLIQSRVVEQHAWLNMDAFLDLVTIAEMTPGPISVNAATFVGIRIAGLPGAIAATAGCIFPSLLIVTLLAYVYDRYKNLSALSSVLGALRAAVVALIAGAGLSILLQVLFGGSPPSLESFRWTGALLFAAAFLVLRRFHLNPIAVMSACGLGGLILGLLAGK